MAAASDLRRGFKFGPFAIIPERGIVRRDGEDVHLEPKQMDALVTLARHYPGVVSKDLLVEEVWGGRATADESIVQCIKGIRLALDNDDPRDPKYVETIHGRGYRLMQPLKIPEQAAVEPGRMQILRMWWIVGAAAIFGLAVIITRMMSGPPAAPIDSVVVMEFENQSREETRADNQWVVDGFAEQLISTLYSVPDLRVLNGNLPDAYESPMEIAEVYGVSSVINGSVQVIGGQVKARVIIYAEDSARQWGDDFNGTLENMFVMHEEVADEVRNRITGNKDEIATPVSQSKDSVAYLRYLRGLSLLATRNRGKMQEAEGLFLESIDRDSGYGPAYLALANTYVLLADYPDPAGRDWFADALRIVDMGKKQDETIKEHAQTYVGYVATKLHNWNAASDAFVLATGSATQYPPAQHYYSRLMAAVGRIDESLKAAEAAWELDQDEQVLNSRLAIAHLWNDDIEKAEEFYLLANDRNESAPIHKMSYVWFLIRKNKINEAREWMRQALIEYSAPRNWVDPVFDQAEISWGSESMIRVMEEYSGEINANALVAFWNKAGRPDKAMDIVEKLVNKPRLLEIEVIFLKEFRIMRELERFPKFLDNIGLSEYWDSVGCQWSKDQDRVVCS